MHPDEIQGVFHYLDHIIGLKLLGTSAKLISPSYFSTHQPQEVLFLHPHLTHWDLCCELYLSPLSQTLSPATWHTTHFSNLSLLGFLFRGNSPGC